MTLPVSTVFFDLGDTLVLRSTREWVPGARALLTALGARGIRLGVLSDTGDLSRAQLAPLLPDSFTWGQFSDDLVLLSRETGLEKADPAAFAQLSRVAAVPASDCLFVTENLSHTLVAQTLGIKVARIATGSRAEADFAQLDRWLGG